MLHSSFLRLVIYVLVVNNEGTENQKLALKKYYILLQKSIEIPSSLYLQGPEQCLLFQKTPAAYFDTHNMGLTCKMHRFWNILRVFQERLRIH